MCEKCGASCPYCGHSPGERVELPPAPGEEDPHGPDREYVCRYCPYVAPNTRSLEEHQAERHRGTRGERVTDVVE